MADTDATAEKTETPGGPPAAEHYPEGPSPEQPYRDEGPSSGAESGKGDVAVLTGDSPHYKEFEYSCPGCAKTFWTVKDVAPGCTVCKQATVKVA